MSPMNRREFLGRTAAAAAGGVLGGVIGGVLGNAFGGAFGGALGTVGGITTSGAFAAEPPKSGAPSAVKLGWEPCCSMYTFRRFPFYEAIEKIASLGFRAVEPAFFLALDKARPDLKTGENLAPEVRKELKARLADRGMRMANFYADVGADVARNRKIFEFAKEMGVRTLVAEPPPEAFDGVEKLCEEFGIDLAVHNHPKGPGSRYWNPDAVLAVCKGRGKRIGACPDTGHWVRSALDPVECLKKMEGRILALHLKDVIETGKPEARDVPLGEGKANYGAVLRDLRRQGFKGVVSVEYEHDSEKLEEEVARCLAFLEAQAKALQGSAGGR
jgi:sugar phosphate isomerase/epimerase